MVALFKVKGASGSETKVRAIPLKNTPSRHGLGDAQLDVEAGGAGDDVARAGSGGCAIEEDGRQQGDGGHGFLCGEVG